MITPVGDGTNIADEERAMFVQWSGRSANDQGTLMTGLAPDDDYALFILYSRLRYPKHLDDTGNWFSSGIDEKYRRLDSWLEPKLEWQMRPYSVHSGTDLVNDHWPHQSYTAVDARTVARDLSIDAGLIWPTSYGDSLGADSRTVIAQHYTAYSLVAQDPETLVEAVRRWLTQFNEDESADLVAETLDNYEVERNLQLLADSGATKLADRLRFLFTADGEDEDDDVPLSIEAMLGFFDFIKTVEYEDISMSATCAHGRLCTQLEVWGWAVFGSVVQLIARTRQ